MTPPRTAIAGRHVRARAALSSLHLDTLVAVHPANVTWLTGLQSSAAAAVVTPEVVWLVADSRYAEAAGAIVSGLDGLVREVIVERSYDETLTDLIAAQPGLVGFEAGALTVARHAWWSATLAHRRWDPARLSPTIDVIECCRAVKDDWECSVLEEAARRLSAVAAGVLAELRPGLRETDVAMIVESGLRRAGFSRPAFDTIVASGPRSALPHGRASSRTIGTGELLVLDFGGVYGGYCVDLTRTVALGDPGPEARRLHAAVERARQAAVAAVRPSAAVVEIDRAARSSLQADGLGHAFSHGTGHGLGLEVHEAPRVAAPHPDAGRSRAPEPGRVPLPDRLEAGMVFTVEPGAYVPGFGGVRIEDDVLVTAGGARVLTSVPRELVLE